MIMNVEMAAPVCVLNMLQTIFHEILVIYARRMSLSLHLYVLHRILLLAVNEKSAIKNE